jgi:hypothetical protein
MNPRRVVTLMPILMRGSQINQGPFADGTNPTCVVTDYPLEVSLGEFSILLNDEDDIDHLGLRLIGPSGRGRSTEIPIVQTRSNGGGNFTLEVGPFTIRRPGDYIFEAALGEKPDKRFRVRFVEKPRK